LLLAIANDECRVDILPVTTVEFEKTDLFGVFRKWCFVPNVRDRAGKWICDPMGMSRHWSDWAEYIIIRQDRRRIAITDDNRMRYGLRVHRTPRYTPWSFFSNGHVM
jgi:hypothetical protein